MTMPHGRAVDLGAIADAANGELPLSMVVAQTLAQLVNEVRGIRLTLTTEESKNHVPVVTPVVSKDGAEKGFGVYCLACSDAAGDYVRRCKLIPADDTDWPAPVLVPIGTDDTPTTASPGVPDFPDEDAEQL